MKKLNKEQELAAKHRDGPMLVLAGPGSGKTAVLTSRIFNLITEYNTEPSRILVLTFSKEAAGEMQERFLRLMQEEAQRGSPPEKSGWDVGKDHSSEEPPLRLGPEGAGGDARNGYSSSGTIFGTSPGGSGGDAFNGHPSSGTIFESGPEGSKNDPNLKGFQGNNSRPPSRSAGVHFGTFHAVFYHILKKQGLYNENSILNQKLKREYIRQAGKRLGIPEYREESWQEFMLQKISSKKSGMEPEWENEGEGELFERLFFEYSENCRRERKLDFDDMITECIRLLTEIPKVLKKWQDKYDYILVDEFQDIDLKQYEVLKLLAGERANIFAVGDDDQSIYGFRGACPEIMKRFKEDHKDIAVVNLKSNYRCRRVIIENAVSLIKHNTDRLFKEQRAENGDKGIIEARIFDSPRREATFVTETIKSLKARRPELSIGVLYRTGKAPEILENELKRLGMAYHRSEKRRNFFEEEWVKDVLSYLKLSVGRGELRDILRILNRPDRGLSREAFNRDRIIAGAEPYLGEEFHRGMPSKQEYSRGMESRSSDGIHRNLPSRWQNSRGQEPHLSEYPYSTRISQAPHSRERYLREDPFHRKLSDSFKPLFEYYEDDEEKLKAVCKLIEGLGFIRDLPVFGAVNYVLKGFAYEKELLKISSGKEEAAMGLEEELFSSLEGHVYASDFLDHVEAVNETFSEQEERNAKNRADPSGQIVLQTVHASKGLEYDVVFVIGLQEGMFPHKKAKTRAEIEEERRLFYVAMTRARERLYICGRKKDNFGKRESRFLYELLIKPTGMG